MSEPSWTTHYFRDKGDQLSGIEYDRAIREQDANFVQALVDAFHRGEFPPQACAVAA